MRSTFEKLRVCALLGFMGCASAQKPICTTRVEFTTPTKIKFTENERLLLCGDPSKESWKEIPPAQAEYTLRNFLKQRAYYTPTFQYQNEILTVKPGPLKLASELTYEGEPKNFDAIHIRDIIGAPLTSELLDKIQNFSLSRLKNMGYACPQVKIQASEETGAIHVFIVTGPLYDVTTPMLADSIGLYPKTLRRFDAFVPGTPYRYEWTKLSSNRAENDGIVVSSQFTFTCPTSPIATSEIQALTLKQQVIAGSQHVLTIGAGASTEEFPIAELTLKSVRLTDTGSNLQFTLYASQRIQKANTIFTDYLFKNAPRFDFAPNVTIEHDNEPTYNITDFQVITPLEYHGDTENRGWLVSFGPSATRQFSSDTTSSAPLTYLSLIGHINFTSHDYELYSTDPRSGWIMDFNVEVLSEGVSTTALASVYKLSGSKLFPLNPVDPPQWILGFRFGLDTVETEQRPQTSVTLPPQYFTTLGGDQNLRGFGRDELAQGTLGGLTSAFLSTEFRYAKTLPLGIEPFVFFDVGALGANPFELDPQLYYSPGVGIRFSTPFGSIRGTVAHGFILNELAGQDTNEHVQVFFSFGREF
jgi:translocation and assembly module TamA